MVKKANYPDMKVGTKQGRDCKDVHGVCTGCTHVTETSNRPTDTVRIGGNGRIVLGQIKVSLEKGKSIRGFKVGSSRRMKGRGM